MGTNITGIGNANAIGFKSRVTGGIYFPPELKDALVGVWLAYGKSNDSTDRNIIKNKIKDRGGDFVISNAAFKLNSGFGKYETDFTTWIQTNGVIASSDKVQNSIVGRFLYFNSVNKKEDVPSFKVNITLGQQSKLQYNYIKEDGTSTYIVYSESGIYTIPASYFSKYTGGNAWFGFYQIEGTSIIEQIPSFEGAFVTDGIDDLITSTKTVQEMGVTDEITIVSMIHQIQLNPSSSITNDIRVSSNNTSGSNGRIVVSAKNKTGIYGWSRKGNTKVIITKILGDKNDYSLAGENSTNYNNKFSVVGTVDNRYNSSVAWYWTIIANKVLTTDQINQVIAYFNLDRTLKSDILCDVKKQGITNENHAEFGDKLIDFSGNGRDIQLNNLAWKGGSGIAAKQYETFKDWTNTPYKTSTVTEIDEFTRVVDSTSNSYWVSMINRTSDFDKVHDSINIVLYQDDMLLVHECKYKIDENVTTKALYETLKSGVNTITLATIDKFTDIPEDAEIMSLGEWVNPKSNKGSVKITLLLSYKGGLLLDGVNDFGKVTGMPIYKDYTFIIDYERISYASSERWVAGVVSKSHVANQGAFILMTANTKVELGKQTYSFGGVTSFNRDDFTRALLYQSKYKCGDVDLTVGGGVDSDTLWLGTFRDNDQRFLNGAIYSLMSFPYSMSEFLIERQLKKHKLGTLYPDMVEFRPVIKANNDYEIVYTAIIKPNNWQEISVGDYVTVGESVAIQIKLNNPLEVTNVSSNSLADVSFYKEETGDNVYTIYGRLLDGKSPQKITMTIE